MGAIKIGAIKMGAIALGSQSQDITSLSNALLSNIGVTYPDGCAGSACTDWKGILAGSKYAGFPLQSVSLENVLTTTGSDSPDNSNPAARLNALPLSDIDIDGSSLGALPVAAYALGGTSIDAIPLNSGDLNPDGTVNQDQTLTDWCSALNGVHWPCSEFGITGGTDTGDAANVTVLSLGIAGVPLGSIPLNTIPLGSSTVDGTAIAGLSLAGTSLNDTGLGAIKIGAIKIGAIKMGAIPIDEVKMGAIKMGAIPLEDLNLSGLNLGTLKIGAIPLQGTKMGAIKIGAIPLASTKIGAIKIGAIKMGAIPLGEVLLSSLSNLSSIVNCSLMPDDCTGVGDTLADAEADGAIQPGADLQTLQAGIAEPNAAWDATSLADVDGSDSSDAGADQTTLADLVALANSNPAFAQAFAVAVLADVASSDPTTSVAQIEAALSGYSDGTTLADLLGAEEVDSGTTIGQLIDEIATDDPSAFNGLFLGDLLAGLLPESTYPWQDVNLSTPGLAAASTGGGEVTLTATTTVLNGPTALTDVLDRPGRLLTGAGLGDLRRPTRVRPDGIGRHA